MCYSGQCPYENHMGDCTIPYKGPGHPIIYPTDAACLIAIEEATKRVLLCGHEDMLFEGSNICAKCGAVIMKKAD